MPRSKNILNTGSLIIQNAVKKKIDTAAHNNQYLDLN